MKLVTTKIRYSVTDTDEKWEKLKALSEKLGIELLHDDGKTIKHWSSLVVTDEEYFQFYEVLDTIENVREV